MAREGVDVEAKVEQLVEVQGDVAQGEEALWARGGRCLCCLGLYAAVAAAAAAEVDARETVGVDGVGACVGLQVRRGVGCDEGVADRAGEGWDALGAEEFGGLDVGGEVGEAGGPPVGVIGADEGLASGDVDGCREGLVSGEGGDDAGVRFVVVPELGVVVSGQLVGEGRAGAFVDDGAGAGADAAVCGSVVRGR